MKIGGFTLALTHTGKKEVADLSNLNQFTQATLPGVGSFSILNIGKLFSLFVGFIVAILLLKFAGKAAVKTESVIGGALPTLGGGTVQVAQAGANTSYEILS